MAHQMNISVFRKDRKNVGDWWSVPMRYFPFTSDENLDLVLPDAIANDEGVVILGGGGLGRVDFEPFLERLNRPDRKYKIIAWGVGADTVTKRGKLLAGPSEMPSLLRYFDGFDEIGTRIHSDDNYGGDARYRWVPCASCMSPLFQKLRATKPSRGIGIYEHLREPLTPHLGGGGRMQAKYFGKYPINSNRGNDLAEKLAYIASFETILTNSYHGVYWATLLGRKVVCFAFKNGLYSFRHAPSYFGDQGLDAALDQAMIYPDALEESRAANLGFYSDMLQKYGDL